MVAPYKFIQCFIKDDMESLPPYDYSFNEYYDTGEAILDLSEVAMIYTGAHKEITIIILKGSGTCVRMVMPIDKVSKLLLDMASITKDIVWQKMNT